MSASQYPPRRDPDRVLVSIGGDIVPVPTLVWKTLKIVWPILRPKANNPDTTFEQMVETSIQVVSGALMIERPDLTPEEMELRLSWKETNELLAKSTELLEKSGFRTVGEVMAASQETMIPESPGTGTLNGSSPNALDEESAAETGTASKLQ